VDDAIVWVIENITRYLEQGMAPFEPQIKERGNRFHVVTITHFAGFRLHSLLLMGGIVGRLFREFAMTLSIAIAVFHGGFPHRHSMMCAHLLNGRSRTAGCSDQRASLHLGSECIWEDADRVLNHAAVTLAIFTGHHRLERLLVHSRAQGIFPAGRTMAA